MAPIEAGPLAPRLLSQESKGAQPLNDQAAEVPIEIARQLEALRERVRGHRFG
jgi:hypothetical protein